MRTMRDLNLTFMMKATWNFCCPTQALWKDVLQGKYQTGRDRFPQIEEKRHGSNFWQGIKANWEVFRDNLVWQLGNGETIRFWEDHWKPNDASLIQIVTQPLNDILSHRRVSDFINRNGD